MMSFQQELEEANERLTSLSKKTLELMENERKRIAGELHDEVGQSLTAIKMANKWLRKRATQPAEIEKIAAIDEMVESTIETVRNISLQLRPAQLDNLGLVAAIKWQSERLFAENGTQVFIEAEGFPDHLPDELEITVFRILQECLTNIARHSHATMVEIKLEQDDRELLICVIDNGVGFNPDQTSRGFGLLNMMERAELADGKFGIRSVPQVGTEIRVRLPLERTEPVPEVAVGRSIGWKRYG